MNEVSQVPVYRPETIQKSIGFALNWQRGIGSRDDIVAAFEQLRSLVRARSVMHIRQSRGCRETVSAGCNAVNAGRVFSRQPRSYTSVILREHVFTAKAGSVWFLSDTELDPETLERAREAGAVDLAIVPLENRPAQSDFLEITFSARVSHHDRLLLEMLAPMIAEAWQSRKPGSVANMISGRAARVARAICSSENKPILDPDNPAGLTRSEFHVCALIHEGRLSDEIARTLNVKKSTLRSHMRSIYMKTGVSSQVELVHRLHGAAASG